MNKILRLITTSVFIIFFTVGCSSKKNNKPKIEDKPPVELYQEAQQALTSANYENATDILEALDSRYPFGAHSDQVQMDLMYAY